jgi:hypothetical protein
MDCLEPSAMVVHGVDIDTVDGADLQIFLQMALMHGCVIGLLSAPGKNHLTKAQREVRG